MIAGKMKEAQIKIAEEIGYTKYVAEENDPQLMDTYSYMFD